jgi:hypothetical protein
MYKTKTKFRSFSPQAKYSRTCGGRSVGIGNMYKFSYLIFSLQKLKVQHKYQSTQWM